MAKLARLSAGAVWDVIGKTVCVTGETRKRMLSYFSRISLAVLACRLALVYGNPAPGAETVASERSETQTIPEISPVPLH